MGKSSSLRTPARMRVSSAALALGVGAAVAAFGPGAAVAAAPQAKAARTLTLNDSASLHLQNKKGLELKESGSAKGTLPGTLYLQLDVTSTRSVTAKVQVYPKGGSISGNAKASYSVAGSTASFKGTLAITKGTGAYSKAKASALSFSGTIQRSNDAVTVHVSGKMSY
ncbi:MAG TPA: autotransporter [Solirubrobacteraceae bacterium]|nr:autotransporter [Solirubrobacteraceae bacterium]